MIRKNEYIDNAYKGMPKPKMQPRNRLPVSLFLIGAIALLSSCSSANPTDASRTTVSDEPVHLTFYARQTISEEDFKLIFTEPLKKRYPHLTLEKIDAAKSKIEDLIAAGQTPDIIFTYGADLKSLEPLHFLSDQTPFIKQQNIDINRFDPVVVSAAKDEKGLYALPLAVQFNALYYNKDIFDKFGVPYPKDGMTWDDTIELAKKVTKMQDGVQYRGLDPESLNRMSFSKSLTYLDAKTEKAAIGSAEWRKMFEMMYAIYNIPGNKPQDLKKSTSVSASLDAFAKEKVVAMWPSVNVLTNLIEAEKQGVNWDMVQYPSYKESPNVYGTVDAHFMLVTSTSKHQAEAMKVIALATSDEVQTISAKQTGRFTPLASDQVKKQFMAGNPGLNGKHMDAIFKSKTAPPQQFTKYEGGARNFAYNALVDYVEGKVDLNTMIRNTEEAINQYVVTQKAGEKK
ncbi:ABC transporter substrate-binding protein [Paenibacillus allorhizosphaerae]|uniref:Extracellular solute-binding protein n=1 Tax=Paenibacillus allorhizosphaerae TaxID=2849866 RepID=A0ABM8VA84_9BACL|nr:ABC transporter substrate-binding protein [Paenibacillus allorhizosphaerae]CAG7615750.1 hypothetical protein PAECIP111802_00207 [Paenibacillus allorhizosphaerae]